MSRGIITTDPKVRRILDAFHIEIYDPDREDIQAGELYDTVEYLHSDRLPRQTDFFVNIGPGSAKTLSQSNVSIPRRLPAPQAFAIDKISMAILPGTNPETRERLEERAWTMWIGLKWYRRMAIGMMNRGTYAEQVMMWQCQHCTRIHLQSVCPGCGSPDMRIFFSNHIPVIAQTQTEYFVNCSPTLVLFNQIEFKLELDTEGLKGPLRMRAWFTGLHSREVM